MTGPAFSGLTVRCRGNCPGSPAAGNRARIEQVIAPDQPRLQHLRNRRNPLMFFASRPQFWFRAWPWISNCRTSTDWLHRLPDREQSEPVVVAFLGTECPLVRLYASRLDEIAAKIRPAGVGLVVINPNPPRHGRGRRRFAAELDLRFPILLDPGQQVADRSGATRQLEVFLPDSATGKSATTGGSTSSRTSLAGGELAHAGRSDFSN